MDAFYGAPAPRARGALGHRLVRPLTAGVRLRRPDGSLPALLAAARSGRGASCRSATARADCCRTSGSSGCAPMAGARRGSRATIVRFRPLAGRPSRRAARRAARGRAATSAFERLRERARAHSQGVAPRIRRPAFQRRAARLPARRPRLARLPPSASASAAASPTTWASARRCRCSRSLERAGSSARSSGRPAAALAGRRAAVARLQLAAGGRALRARAPRARPHRRRAPRPRSTASPSYDVVLTTYGTLRRDIADAQGRRRSTTRSSTRRRRSRTRPRQAAKAARLLRAQHRLALSGTPIENHLGELWVAVRVPQPRHARRGVARSAGRVAPRDAARPGDRGAARARRCGRSSCAARRSRWRRSCRRAAEQTIYCELEPAAAQAVRRAARALPRSRCSARSSATGLGTSKIHVLEALLRLRQAACHPGLIDATTPASPSAKLDVLLPRLHEVVEEGHKVLVFSQFTSFLAIVARAARRARARLRVPRRPDARPRGAGASGSRTTRTAALPRSA